MHSYEDYDYKTEFKKENEELKKIIDAKLQEIDTYRAFISLIESMKSCERFIDKEKAFDEIIKSLPKPYKESEDKTWQE